MIREIIGDDKCGRMRRTLEILCIQRGLRWEEEETEIKVKDEDQKTVTPGD